MSFLLKINNLNDKNIYKDSGIFFYKRINHYEYMLNFNNNFILITDKDIIDCTKDKKYEKYRQTVDLSFDKNAFYFVGKIVSFKIKESTGYSQYLVVINHNNKILLIKKWNKTTHKIVYRPFIEESSGEFLFMEGNLSFLEYNIALNKTLNINKKMPNINYKMLAEKLLIDVLENNLFNNKSKTNRTPALYYNNKAEYILFLITIVEKFTNAEIYYSDIVNIISDNYKYFLLNS